METRTNWGIVAFACLFVVLAIGVAVSTTYFESDTAEVTTVVGEGGTSSNADWRATLDAIAVGTVDAAGNYTAPAELSVTDRLSREIFAKYLQLKQNGDVTDEQIRTSVAELVAKNVTPIEPTNVYTLGSIKSGQNVTLDAYAGALGSALQASTEIKKYEMLSFSEAIGKRNYSGSAELQTAAAIYRTVEQDLLKTSVPTELASEHLALLISVQALAQSVELMSKWGGDPIEAFAYMDAFNKAERASQLAVNKLFTKMGTLTQGS